MIVVSDKWRIYTRRNKYYSFFFFFQAEDGIRDYKVTGVQTCALPIWSHARCAGMPYSGRSVRWSAARAARSRSPQAVGVRLSHELTPRICTARAFEIGRASCRERV